jgi:Flp pilus assembly protein TadG
VTVGSARGTAKRGRSDEGAAVLEFSIVMVLLFTLVFGVITFGMLLSFRQNMVQSAAEAARAGAIAPSGTSITKADLAAQQSVSAFDQVCTAQSSGLALECWADPIVACPGNAAATCITYNLKFNYADNPFLPTLPFMGALLPDTIEVSSTAQVNP